MNTIDSYRVNYSQSFGARYLKLVKQENIPQKIVDSVYKSDAIEDFLNAGKKKNIFLRFLDLFRKDEVLEVEYLKDTVAQRRSLKNPNDPHESHATLFFSFGREGVKNPDKKLYYEINDSQHGVFHNKNGQGRVLRDGEHPYLDAPQVTVEDTIAEKVANLDRLDNKLKKLQDIED